MIELNKAENAINSLNSKRSFFDFGIILSQFYPERFLDRLNHLTRFLTTVKKII